MGWITNNRAILKLATEDITVYKVLVILTDRSLVSFIQNYRYEIGKRYDSDIHISSSISKEIIIREGIHSYSPEVEVDYCHMGVTVGNFVTVDKNKNRIFKCIIPKGSMYAKNEYNEVVSSSIIITDYIVDIENLPKKSDKFLRDCKLIKYEND